MYSYDDRVRAVELYIKLGKRVAATLRQFGYLTKNALKSWHREFERSQDLPKGYVRSMPKYSDEQKKLAVDHYLAHGRCMAATIKALHGIDEPSRRSTVRARARGTRATAPNASTRRSTSAA